MILLKRDRGEMANACAWIWYFESEAVRNKYFNSEGNMTDPALNEKMVASMEVLREYAIELGMTDYTDWIVL